MIPITSTLISTLASFTFLPLLSKGVHFIVLVKGFIYLFVWLDICCHTKVSWRDCEEVVPGGEIARKLCIEQTYKSCCAVTDYLPCIEREWDLNKPNVLLSQRIWALPDCFDTCILCEVLVYLLFYEHNASISSCSKKKKMTCIFILRYCNKEVCLEFCWAGCRSSVLCSVVVFVCFSVKRASLRETCHGAEWQWIRNDEFLLRLQWS